MELLSFFFLVVGGGGSGVGLLLGFCVKMSGFHLVMFWAVGHFWGLVLALNFLVGALYSSM